MDKIKQRPLRRRQNKKTSDHHSRMLVSLAYTHAQDSLGNFVTRTTIVILQQRPLTETLLSEKKTVKTGGMRAAWEAGPWSQRGENHSAWPTNLANIYSKQKDPILQYLHLVLWTINVSIETENASVGVKGMHVPFRGECVVIFEDQRPAVSAVLHTLAWQYMAVRVTLTFVFQVPHRHKHGRQYCRLTTAIQFWGFPDTVAQRSKHWLWSLGHSVLSQCIIPSVNYWCGLRLGIRTSRVMGQTSAGHRCIKKWKCRLRLISKTMKSGFPEHCIHRLANVGY